MTFLEGLTIGCSNIGSRNMWADFPTFVVLRHWDLVALYSLCLARYFALKGSAIGPSLLKGIYWAFVVVPLLAETLIPYGPYFPYYCFSPQAKHEGSLSIIPFWLVSQPFLLVNVGLLIAAIFQRRNSATRLGWCVRVGLLVLASLANEYWLYTGI